MKAAYDDGTVRVYHAEHAALAEHLRETGERPDAMIVDAPYHARTHDGHNGATGLDPSRMANPEKLSRAIGYACWSTADVGDFAARWAGVVRGWIVSLTDHTLARSWEECLEGSGRYVFSPLACVESGSRVRLSGDGPAQWSTFAVAARPRSRDFASWGALPGAYVGGSEAKAWVGGKPVWLIRALVRDYSRPGDLIVDPCCGAGTLGVAVRYEGRRAILADKDPAAVECTIKRLRGERTKPTRDDFPETAEQPSLFAREAEE